MRAVDIIRKKRDGAALSPEELAFVAAGAADGSLPDYQATALLMAIFLRGLSADETWALTDAMIRTGARADFSHVPGPKVDKHSTGGVGDKSSIVIAPLVAACGARVPMMSGRGLGHTGGTLDKLESIPGFRTNLTIAEAGRVLSSVGCALMGQTAEIAPADRRLYALRDVTATVESIPLIAASIMSKKIAEGIDALVLDVKCGAGAFMKSLPRARELAERLVAIGRASGVATQALITSMDAPIGEAVGNASEIVECLELMKGRARPDLRENVLALSERMLVAGGIAPGGEEARGRCLRALESGAALERFRAVIAAQGGDPRVVDDYRLLPRAPEEHVVTARADGFVARIDAGLVGRACVALGAGRRHVDEAIDPGVGIMVPVRPGDEVRSGDPLLRLCYRSRAALDEALALVSGAVALAETPPPSFQLVLDEVL